jgi:hypothetical protein
VRQQQDELRVLRTKQGESGGKVVTYEESETENETGSDSGSGTGKGVGVGGEVEVIAETKAEGVRWAADVKR